MKPIRTLFVATALPVGGAERIIQHLVMGLDRTRFDVAVATLREPGRVGEEIAAAGIPLRHGWTGPQKLDPLLIPRFREWLRREGFRILYFLDHPHAIFHGMLASLATPVRLRVMPVHTTGRWGGRASVPRSTRLFLPWIDRLIAIAEAQREYLAREEGIPDRKMAVIRNAIPAEEPDAATRAARRAAVRSELAIDPRAPVVAILAVLRPEKNHELLLRALAEIAPPVEGLVVLVIGDGPRHEFLEAETLRLGLHGTVRFLGHQPQGRRFWAAADLAVLCSHPRVETLPLSLMEAMDAALPVVATDVGALRELVTPGENGELVPPGSADALSGAILRILSDPARARAYGEESQRRVARQYRVGRMVRETEELLLRLLPPEE